MGMYWMGLCLTVGSLVAGAAAWTLGGLPHGTCTPSIWLQELGVSFGECSAALGHNILEPMVHLAR